MITPLDAPEEFRDKAAAERQRPQAGKDTAASVRALGLADHWRQLLDSGKANMPASIRGWKGSTVTRVQGNHAADPIGA